MSDPVEAPVETTDPPTVEETETPVEEVESFTDIDPAEAPDGEITAEWLQERYKQMQADYTRKRQAEASTAKERQEELEFLEALRSDPETQKAVLEQLQELLDEDESDDEYDDDDEDPESDIERQVRELREAEESRQTQALAKAVVTHIEQLAKDSELELDEDDLRDIFGRATAGDQVNNQATESAFKAWQDREKAKHTKWQASYLKSKQAPTQVPPGQSAEETPDLSKREERIKRMAAILQANE